MTDKQIQQQIKDGIPFTCSHCNQVIEGKPEFYTAYWCAKGTTPEFVVKRPVHKDCKTKAIQLEAYECQCIDCACNDCFHFIRAEDNHDKGCCTKFKKNVMADPMICSPANQECFEHRKKELFKSTPV